MTLFLANETNEILELMKKELLVDIFNDANKLGLYASSNGFMLTPFTPSPKLRRLLHGWLRKQVADTCLGGRRVGAGRTYWRRAPLLVAWHSNKLVTESEVRLLLFFRFVASQLAIARALKSCGENNVVCQKTNRPACPLADSCRADPASAAMKSKKIDLFLGAAALLSYWLWKKQLFFM